MTEIILNNLTLIRMDQNKNKVIPNLKKNEVHINEIKQKILHYYLIDKNLNQSSLILILPNIMVKL